MEMFRELVGRALREVTLRSVIAKTQSKVRSIHSGFTIDAALKDRLQTLSLENAKQVLEKLVDRVQRTDVRNPKAYLMTLMMAGSGGARAW